MKKSNLFLLGGGALAVFLMFQLKNCKNNQQPTILVDRIHTETKTDEGSWTPSDPVPDIDPDSVFVDGGFTDPNPREEELQKDLDHVTGRYLVYKKRAYELLNRIQELDSRILASLDCDEKRQLKDEQIAAMKLTLAENDSIMNELFHEIDTKGQRRNYSGQVSGDHFTTSWKSTVFGVMPADGMQIKTDVTAVTTTIEKPIEVWDKNAFEIFGGLDTEVNYLLGLGYERRNRRLGLFGQFDVYPQRKEVIGRGGIRIHW